MLVDAVVLEPASIRRLNATAGHELLVRYMLPNGEIVEKMVPAANLQPTLQRTRRAMAASRLGDESEPPSRSKRRAASSPSAQHSQERSLSKRTHGRPHMYMQCPLMRAAGQFSSYMTFFDIKFSRPPPIRYVKRFLLARVLYMCVSKRFTRRSKLTGATLVNVLHCGREHGRLTSLR